MASELIAEAGFTPAVMFTSVLTRAKRTGALALGSTRSRTVYRVVLPAAKTGIITAVILGIARVIGETAPLITIGALSFIAFLPPSPVTGEFPFLNFEWLMSEFTAMPIQIFNWVSRPDQAFQQNAAAAAAILLGMTLAMNAVAIWIRYRFRKKINW